MNGNLIQYMHDNGWPLWSIAVVMFVIGSGRSISNTLSVLFSKKRREQEAANTAEALQIAKSALARVEDTETRSAAAIAEAKQHAEGVAMAAMLKAQEVAAAAQRKAEEVAEGLMQCQSSHQECKDELAAQSAKCAEEMAAANSRIDMLEARLSAP